MKNSISFFMTMIALLTCSNGTYAQNVTIPDLNFKMALVANLAINTNGDANIQVSEAAAFTGLIDVQQKGIADLTGIAAFPLITGLNCFNNQLTSLDVSNNTALTSLTCSGNQLTSLNISVNTALDTLKCYNNQLTNLDVSTNTALTYLYCGNNQLTNLNVSTNTALTSLQCGVNQLSNLNVSTNTALITLTCYSNQLSNLNVSPNTALIHLHCYNNQLSSLNVSTNTALTHLYCYKNQLSNLNVSTNTALISLDCGFNQLTNLNVSINTALIYLNCFNNQLTSLDVSSNTALTYLICRGNQLTSLNVSVNTALTELNCYNNQLSNLNVTTNTALTSLDCGANQLTNLNVSTNTALIILYCGNNQLSNLDVSTNTALTSLGCGVNQLSNLDVSTNTALTILQCYSNQLSNLDLLTNTALTYLDCRTNPNLLCLPLLPPGLITLLTNVTCLPNIPVALLPPANALPLCSSLSINPCFAHPLVSGHVFIDVDNNGSQGVADFNVPYRVVSAGNFATLTDPLADYNLVIDTNLNENVTIQNFNFNTNYYTLTPPFVPVTTNNSTGQLFPNTGFRLVPIGIQSDAEAYMIAGSVFRPGFVTTIGVLCRNEGNTVINPTITVAIDPNLTVLSCSMVPNGGGPVSNNMTFSSTGLVPLWQVAFYIQVFTPVNVAVGTPIVNTTSVAIVNEVTPPNNTATMNDVVVGSYDPNDKTANISYITPAEVTARKPITYTIRFQNTGTFPADFVIVTDTLDNDLDASSLEPISTSHTLSKMTLTTDMSNSNQYKVVKWYFYNINLADSTSDEAASHGYISFRIRPKTGLALGTLIENKAGIVFDYNTPIITNTCTIPVSANNSIVETKLSELGYTIYPNPAQNTLYIQSKISEEYSISLLSINGQVIYTAESKTELTELDMQNLQNGVYLLQIVDKQSSYTQKVLKM